MSTIDNEQLIEFQQKGRIEFVTFHPSYSYEDFIEGIRAKTEDGTINYVVEDGIFKRICKKAEESYDKALKSGEVAEKFVIVIDEINRGNIPKIFGELITLIEKDKRKGEANCIPVTLPYSRTTFCVPPNLYIIATMNTADASIALIDIALRRRFSFIELPVDYEVLINHCGYKNQQDVDSKCKELDIKALSIKALQKINERILKEENLGKEKQIGHSYLWDIDDDSKLVMVWRYDILPLLQEYLYGRYEEMANLLKDEGTLVDKDNCIIKDFDINYLKAGLLKVIG